MAVNQLKIEDRGIFFMSVNLMDRYFTNIETPFDQNDMFLTLITSLMISSKYFEVYPLDISDCIKMSGYNFSKDAFLKKESQIISAIQCNLDMPHLLDFNCFFFKVMKLRMQDEDLVSDKIIKFLAETETLAYDFCKAFVSIHEFLTTKLSYLSVSSLFLAFQLSTKHNICNPDLDQREVEKAKQIFKSVIVELLDMQTWIEIHENAPKVFKKVYFNYCEMK